MTRPLHTDSDAPERLLGEAGWLTGVAARLGCHAASADDAVQETLLAALSQRDREPGRGWLRTVLRRRVGMEQRADARRQARERLVARAERDDLDPSAALEAVELNGRLLRAVAELPRRDREVIALRFGAGLAPAEIAETLNVSANAVSSRISRAIAQLRLALDDPPRSRHHGLALLPLITATLMKKNVALVLVLAIVAALVPLGMRALDRDSSPEPAREAVEPDLVAVSGQEAKEILLEPEGEMAEARAEVEPVSVEKPLPEAEEVGANPQPSGGTVRVRVVEAVTGRPAAGVGAKLVGFHSGPFWSQVRRGVTDSQGILQFDDVSEGRPTVYLGRISSSGSYESERANVVAGETALVTFEVDHEAAVPGRVVDEAGAPVPGARIWVAYGMAGTDDGDFVANADAQGLFEIRYVGGVQFLSASAPGYAASPAAAFDIGSPRDEDGRMRLVLGSRRGVLRGTVTDGDGTPIGGAMVTLKAQGSDLPIGGAPLSYRRPPMLTRRTDELGRFQFEDATTEAASLQARVVGSGLWDKTVHVPDGGVLEVPIQLVPGGTVRGRVLDEAGTPSPAATVSVLPSIDGAMSRMETQCGEDGTFELRGLTPGRVEFMVKDKIWSRKLRERVLVSSDQVTEWDPILPDPKVLRGRVISDSGKPLARWHVSTWPVHDGVVARVSMGAKTRPDGSFSFSPDYGEQYEIGISAPGGYSYPILRLGPMEIPDEDRDYVIPDDRVPSAGIFGRIVDANGQGLAATITAVSGGPAPRHISAQAADDGTFRIDYLSSETFDLSVVADGVPKKEIQGADALAENELRDLGEIVLQRE